MLTKNVQGVGFGRGALTPDECGTGQDTGFDLVPICTENNLTEYKFPPHRNGKMQCALVVVASLRVASAAGAGEPGRKTFMVERLKLFQGADELAACQKNAGEAEVRPRRV